MSSDVFDIKKLLSSFFQFIPWVKELKTIACIALVGFVGLTIYRAYFMPTTSQKQNTTISVAQGGTLNLQQNQGIIKERRWFIGPTFMINKNKDYYIGATILRSF